MFHRQEQVIVGDAQIVDAHDVGMLDLAQDLEFLQEALHRLVDAGFLADGGRDLEHHYVSVACALGEKQLRHRTLGDEFDAPVFLEPGSREVLGHLRAGRHAPAALRLGLFIGGAADRIVELGVLDLGLADDLERAGGACFHRIGGFVFGRQENDRRETLTAMEILEPVETRAAFPSVIEQHGAVTLREESRRQRPAHARVVAHQLDVGPGTGNMVTQQRAVPRVVIDQHQAHLSELEHAWQGIATQRVGGLFDRDQDIPDIRARRAGVHEIFGSFERGAGIELAPRPFDVAAGDLGALDRS